MYEKLVTFEEEKRKEYLYLLFNSIFICGSFIVFFNGYMELFLSVFDGVESDSLRFSLQTIFRPLLCSVGVFIPFFIYNVRRERPLRKKLRPSVNKFSPVYLVLGAVAVVAAVPAFVYLGETFCAFLVERGYIINETVYDTGSTLSENIFFVLWTSAISAFVLELVFRGVAVDRLQTANLFHAIFIPSLISSLYVYSFVRIPYLFVVSVVISWIYIKTQSLYLSMLLNFCATATFSVLQIIKNNGSEEYFSLLESYAFIAFCVFFVALVLLLLLKGAKLSYPAPRDKDEEFEKLTVKEAVIGPLKSFGLWVFLFIFAFQVLFLYLDKHDSSAEDLSPEVRIQTYVNL